MRLLHTTDHKFEEFDGNNVPLYAILSHTWRRNEISFQDVQRGNAHENAAYDKIRNSCSVAAAHGFDYIWIDTCCIDKTSSAELSEAINSMYHWYQESGVCYAYLADMTHKDDNAQVKETISQFFKSRWFTRGWTLQELIAPETVIFLDQDWHEIGTKLSLQEKISTITGIPADFLLGHNLKYASVAQRMSWASKRETSRKEDIAYCLMGIFRVNMPMLYGEGERAFIRLQEEIMKVSDDHSLFAWISSDRQAGILATSPAAFSSSSQVVPLKSYSTLSGAITVNNKGIYLKLHFIDTELTPSSGVQLAVLPCSLAGKRDDKVAIYVRALSDTMEYFERTMSNKLKLIDLNDFKESKRERSICIRQEQPRQKSHSTLPKAAADGNFKVTSLLLDRGGHRESRDLVYGRTSLSWAAGNGHIAVVRLLLDRGANIEAKDLASGRKPLSWAAGNGHAEVVELLLDMGAELESADIHDGRTPLSWAAESGHTSVVKILIEKGAEVDSKGNMDRTPLSWAAGNGHEEVVKLLLDKGAGPESKAKNGWTPFSYAVGGGYQGVIMLLERGVEKL
jgi:ankyrin repeat protein